MNRITKSTLQSNRTEMGDTGGKLIELIKTPQDRKAGEFVTVFSFLDITGDTTQCRATFI